MMIKRVMIKWMTTGFAVVMCFLLDFYDFHANGAAGSFNCYGFSLFVLMDRSPDGGKE